MSSKKGSTGAKRKAVRTTIEVKKIIVAKYESGVRVTDLAEEYKIPRSTISTFIQNKQLIKCANVAKGVVTMYSKQRSATLEEMENLLRVWIEDKQRTGEGISQAMICEKAKALHSKLVKDSPGTSEEFKASRGWLHNFRKRAGICGVVRHGEAVSTDQKSAEDFATEFGACVHAQGYVPQQVFNCDETGLFWKKMPSRTFITKEEQKKPGHKPMKDRLTLLLCSNASGDFKVKPLLIYHSENPRAFKHVNKVQLGVQWRANPKAWMTRQIFVDWVNEVFGPSVRKYLSEHNLPQRALLVLDDAPAHPPGLQESISEDFKFITVKFLPPNMTPLLQPMNQQVVTNFKKLYTKAMFKRCLDVTSDTELTLKEFWKSQFNILHCVGLIVKAWQEVSYRTLNSAWKKLYPEAVLDSKFEGFGEKPESIVEDIVSMGKSMGLEVNNEDIEELVEEHNQDLTTEELQELHREQQKVFMHEVSSEEEKVEITSAEIQEICAMWSKVSSFCEKHHPNVGAVQSIQNQMDDVVLSHFRNVLKKRQTQSSLDSFLVKMNQSEGCAKGQKRPREKTPQADMPSVMMEGDSPSKK